MVHRRSYSSPVFVHVVLAVAHTWRENSVGRRCSFLDADAIGFVLARLDESYRQSFLVGCWGDDSIDVERGPTVEHYLVR